MGTMEAILLLNSKGGSRNHNVKMSHFILDLYTFVNPLLKVNTHYKYNLPHTHLKQHVMYISLDYTETKMNSDVFKNGFINVATFH